MGIGFLIYWLVPGIPLIPAFALAAVLSPTDAVALSGIVGEGRIPKKIMGILQGEALMNDASGLVSLKFAVAVAMGTMVFTVGGATLEFFKVAIGGILAGFVVSWLYGRSLRFLSRWGGDEPATQIVLLFLLPFASYLIAEHIGVSASWPRLPPDDHHPFWRNAPRAAGNAFAREQYLGDAGICL
ncbi:Na+/H+ antiporter [Salmonella enterica subsp. enterica serovar Sanjuan]|uniref:Na+/H+ antiporter n=1 Tax=Salmonella enterica subsp. enterica serovar Sanjuan TaxID=1160765 RepID=A0A447P250_SALET|nr:Na+/H+ antiporter [Salmonella enterica subsp. enterica serovar Sanjuan]